MFKNFFLFANSIVNIKFLNRFTWTIDVTLTDNTTPGQSRYGSNDNKSEITDSSDLQKWSQMQFSIIPRAPLFW